MRIAKVAALVVCSFLAIGHCAAATQESATSQVGGDWLCMAQELAQHPSATPAADESATPSASGAGEGLSKALTTKPARADKAQSPATGEKPWEVQFKVYGWLAGANGTVGVGNRSSHLDVDYCDVLENLDLIHCMVPVNLEGRIGHWGAYADLFYVRLVGERDTRVGTARLIGKQTILEVGGFYRVGTWQLGSKSDSSLTLDVIGGARYNRVEGNVGLELPRRSISIGSPREWWDPFVGPRVIWKASDKFNVFARGDVGGFGIENCSHFVWQVIAGAQYNFTENIFVELGYRLLDTDYEAGNPHFVYDVQMQGPYLAFGVKF